MVAGGGLFCGLGRALALEHVRHGGDVILVARHAAKLQALSAELCRAALGQQVESVVVDFTAADAAQRVFAAVGRPRSGDGAGECGGAHGVVEIIFTGDGGARTRVNFKRGVRRGVFSGTGTSDLFCNQGVFSLA